MRKTVYYDDYDENDVIDEEVDGITDPSNDGYGPDGRIDLDDPDDEFVDQEYTETENDVDYKKKAVETNLLLRLRNELKFMEIDRGSLEFRHDGVDYEGVPMLEINSNKFVFKLLPEGKLKSFNLSDIVIK